MFIIVCADLPARMVHRASAAPYSYKDIQVPPRDGCYFGCASQRTRGRSVRIASRRGTRPVCIKTILGGIAAALLCTACATSRVQPEGVAAPVAFEQSTTGQPAWPGKDWYRGFASTELDGLVA